MDTKIKTYGKSYIKEFFNLFKAKKGWGHCYTPLICEQSEEEM